MTKLISAIQDIIKVFQTYSEKDSSQNKLNSEELNLLIQNEFVDVIKNPKDPNTISSLLAILDENNDGEVDFNEFCDLLCKVLKAYYKVVYEKEDTCQQPDEPKKNVETTPQSTSQTPDEPPSYYQKPLRPKCEKTQSTYHDQKGACAGEKNQICTQTDQKTEEKDSTGSQSQDCSQGKDQTSQKDPKEPQSQGKEQISQVDTTVSQSHSESGKDQVQGTISSQSASCDQGKDQTSQSTTTTGSQSTSYDQGKDQTSQSTTTGSQSTSYDQGKDQTSQSTTTTGSQSSSSEQGKDQTSQSTTTIGSQSTSCGQGKDQTSQSTTTGSQSTSYDQGKDQTSQSTTTGSQSTSCEQGKDQTSKPTTTGSQSQGKEQIMMAENTTTADQPGQTEEAQNFYRQPLYIPPAQSFGLEAQASSQPPSYSQTQQDPTPTCQETQKEPNQSQQNKFYQHQQTFSLDKKNP